VDRLPPSLPERGLGQPCGGSAPWNAVYYSRVNRSTTVVDAINDMLRDAKDLSVWERLAG